MTTRPPLRIGDTERDTAVTALGEHYAAGRLTKDEYDERTQHAWAARFDQDVQPLFADLPGDPRGQLATAPRRLSETSRSGARQGRRWSKPHPAMLLLPFMWLAPLVVVALVALVIVTGAPWLLFMLFWLWIFTGFGRRRHPAGRGAHW